MNALATEPEPCFYCGVPANSIDHVIPRVILRCLDPAVARDHRYRWTVRACHECNTLLGSRVFDTLEARRAALKDILRRRHKRLLDAPDWTEAELAACGPVLQGYLRQQQRRRHVLQARLRWPHP